MRYILFFMVMMFANVAQAMDCEKVPTCEELGYSTESEPNCADNGYMYCPFNHEYKKCVNMDCAKLGFTEDDKTSWCAEIVNCKGNPKYTACNCLKPRCNIGDVFYADGSCGDVKDYSEDKIAVGVVYYTNCAGGGKVINLKNLDSHMWSPAEKDISELKDWSCPEILSTAKTEDRNNEFWSAGKSYTEIISTALDNALRYAAPAAKAFCPQRVRKEDPIVGAGKWYLPTLGEWMDLYGYDYSNIASSCHVDSDPINDTKEKVNATLVALKGLGVEAEKFPSGYAYYWSSLQGDKIISWKFHINNGKISSSNKDAGDYVRASLKF